MTAACPGPMSGWKRTPWSYFEGRSALGLSSQLPTERTQTCAHGGDHRRCGSCRPEPVDEPRVVLEAAGDEDDVVRRRLGHLMVGNRADEVCAQALDSVRQPGGDRLPEAARATARSSVRPAQHVAPRQPPRAPPLRLSTCRRHPRSGHRRPAACHRGAGHLALGRRRRPAGVRPPPASPAGRSVPTATGAPREQDTVGWAARARHGGPRPSAGAAPPRHSALALGERGDALHHRLPRGRRLDRAPSMREADEPTAPAASSRASCGGVGVQVQLPLSRRPLRAVVSASEQRDSPAASGRRPVSSGLLARGPRLGGAGSDFIPADVGASYLVRDPFDLRLGEHLPEKFEFGGAGLSVAGRRLPRWRSCAGSSGSCRSGSLSKSARYPSLVEDLGQDRHLLVEALAGQLVSGLLDTPASAPLEDAGDELGVFLLDVAEQLDARGRRRLWGTGSRPDRCSGRGRRAVRADPFPDARRRVRRT